MTSTDLAKRTTVTELVATFQQAEAEIRDAFATISRAERRLNDAFMMGECRHMGVRSRYGGHRLDFGSPDDALVDVRRDAWRAIVERLELRRMMSIERWHRLERELADLEPPPITVEKVSAFAAQYVEAIPEMATEAVTEVFEWLRPRRSKLKTNSELEVGERVILPRVVEAKWMGPGFRVNYHYQQNLTALENVLHALDGDGQVAKAYDSALKTAIEASEEGVGETELFEFRACKNGNLHLRFKRVDLLARLNAAAGGKRMRPVAAN